MPQFSLAIPFVHDYTALIALSIMRGMLLGPPGRDLDDHLPQPADPLVAAGIAIYSIRVGFCAR